MTDQQLGSPWAPYQVRTHNASSQSENRIHSDEVAKRFGFKGALVPGVTVFAHMTRPLVERYGERWLARGLAEVRFVKPAYEGDLLTVATSDAAKPAVCQPTRPAFHACAWPKHVIRPCARRRQGRSGRPPCSYTAAGGR